MQIFNRSCWWKKRGVDIYNRIYEALTYKVGVGGGGWKDYGGSFNHCDHYGEIKIFSGI